MRWSKSKTYGDVIEHAKEKGARFRILPNGVKELKGPAGTLLVTGREDEQVPPETKKTIWKWMKLAGIIVILLMTVRLFLVMYAVI